jgi:hypothetical protein
MSSSRELETDEDENDSSSSASSVEFDAELMRDRDFIQKVRSRLRTEEQQRYFDFLIDVPKPFAMAHVGRRWTHELIADFLHIDQSRLPSLNKSIKRAFRKQVRILHIHEGSRVQVVENEPTTRVISRQARRQQQKINQLASLYR